MSFNAIWSRNMSPSKRITRERGWAPTSGEPRQRPGAWTGEAYLVPGVCHDPRRAAENTPLLLGREATVVIAVSDSDSAKLLMLLMTRAASIQLELRFPEGSCH